MLKKLRERINRRVVNRFGSKWGAVNFFRFLVGSWLGEFRAQRKLDFSRIERLVFICKGNICRSPLGAEYARSIGLSAISFGLDTEGNQAADPRAIDFANRSGMDLTGHRTQRINHYTPMTGDLLIVMEPAHLEGVQHHSMTAQVTLAGLWVPPYNAYIHDPYSSTSTYFDICEQRVIKSVDGLLKQMNTRLR